MFHNLLFILSTDIIPLPSGLFIHRQFFEFLRHRKKTGVRFP